MIATIGIGTNLGDKLENIKAAISAIRAFAPALRVSGIYLAKPWGLEKQPDFYNAVAMADVQCEPRELLIRLQSIEKELGREECHQVWGPRIIDLDILTFGDLVVKEPDLTIPHPYMMQRLFVLAPMAELDNRYAQYIEDGSLIGQQVERISELPVPLIENSPC